MRRRSGFWWAITQKYIRGNIDFSNGDGDSDIKFLGTNTVQTPYLLSPTQGEPLIEAVDKGKRRALLISTSTSSDVGFFQDIDEMVQSEGRDEASGDEEQDEEQDEKQDEEQDEEQDEGRDEASGAAADDAPGSSAALPPPSLISLSQHLTESQLPS